MYILYIFKIYFFCIFFAYTKYIFVYLCNIYIYFIQKIYISENIYKIYLAILAVYIISFRKQRNVMIPKCIIFCDHIKTYRSR